MDVEYILESFSVTVLYPISQERPRKLGRVPDFFQKWSRKKKEEKKLPNPPNTEKPQKSWGKFLRPYPLY